MPHRQPPHDPRPDPGAVARIGNARFTWLGPRILRLEWAEDGHFEDRASLVAVNRNLEPPEWRSWTESEWTLVASEDVTLRYRPGSDGLGEGDVNVEAVIDGRRVRWSPGMSGKGNLGGTVRTLDGVGERIDLGSGLLSRDGWVWIDDSETPLFDGGDPPWVEPRRPGRRLDGYLLLHGPDYRRALGDWARIGGRIPMPPRYAFGVWWSRYWAYTDVELLELVEEFRARGTPLDVLVVDMDWHETFELRWGRGERDAAGQKKGWTGYTWNRAYFPDPEAFLGRVREQGVRTALNLHPASGVHGWEEPYRELAAVLGLDPDCGDWIPFRIEDPSFARAFMDAVIRPLERQGVNFWWLDWQQWSQTGIPGLNPTMWLNHVFFTEMERRGEARPLILHRFGGLGSHRYQVGFSGDAASTWEALALEPEFTSTAANVLFGYWSHDIGGHEPGPVSAELFARWLQFGALSPILRTHATRHPEAERRFWAFPPEAESVMKEALRLRGSLVPYLYTAARDAFESGVSIVRPLYYDWPDREEAYRFTDQYLLGRDLVVAPVTEPVGWDGLALRRVWLPPGAWVEWGSLERFSGPQTVERGYGVDEIPLFVRAGSVLPRALDGTPAGETEGPLVVSVFSGADGESRLYEDAGDDLGYLRGELRWTPLRARWGAGGARVTIEVGMAEGTFPGASVRREIRIRLHGVPPPSRVFADGAEIEAATGEGEGRDRWNWNGDRLELEVLLAERRTDRPTTVDVDLTRVEPALLDGVPGLLRRARHAVAILHGLWPDDAAPDALVRIAQAGRRMTLEPGTVADELRCLREELPGVVRSLSSLQGDRIVIDRARALLRPTTESGGGAVPPPATVA